MTAIKHLTPLNEFGNNTNDPDVAERVDELITNHSNKFKVTLSIGNEVDESRLPTNTSYDDLNIVSLHNCSLFVCTDNLESEENNVYYYEIDGDIKEFEYHKTTDVKVRTFTVTIHGAKESLTLSLKNALEGLSKREVVPVCGDDNILSYISRNHFADIVSKKQLYLKEKHDWFTELNPITDYLEGFNTNRNGKVTELSLVTEFGIIDLTDFRAYYDSTSTEEDSSKIEMRYFKAFVNDAGTPLIMSVPWNDTRDSIISSKKAINNLKPEFTDDKFYPITEARNCRIHTPIEFVHKLDNIQFKLINPNDPEQKEPISLPQAVQI